MAQFYNRMIFLITFATALSVFAAGPVLQSSGYSPDDNVLTLEFNEPVNTHNILTGLISFDDDNGGPKADLVIQGSEILTTDSLSSTVNISLLYGDIVETFTAKYYLEPAFLFKLWGTQKDQVKRLEGMDLSNLKLKLAAEAFFSDAGIASEAQVLECETGDVTRAPEILSATYDANVNKVTFVFSDTVQFDQIAEDRARNGGPGDRLLQGRVGTDDAGEDRNGNGVLEFEQNINFFMLGFNGPSASLRLENIEQVSQKSDADTLDIFLTLGDSKKLETTLGLDGLSLDVDPWAFVDQYYNPNQASGIAVSTIPDSVDFVPDSALYNVSKNELSIFFPNLDLAGREIVISNPSPIYPKFSLDNGINSYTLSGVYGVPTMIPGTNKTGFKFKLSIRDQAGVEPLFDAAVTTLAISNYALYDNLNNGNSAVSGVPIRVTTSTSPNDAPPTLQAAEYSLDEHTLKLTWNLSLGVGFYNGVALVPEEDAEVTTLTGFSAYDVVADSALSLGEGKVYYSGSKKNTYVKLEAEDATTFERYENLESLRIVAERDVFNAFLFFNGNLAINSEDSIDITIVADTTAPHLSNSKLDVFNKILSFEINEPVKVSDVSAPNFAANGITLAGVVENAGEGSEYDTAFEILLTESVFESFMALPDSVLTNSKLTATGAAFKNISSVVSLADTIAISVGRNFFLKSFEAFAPPPATRFGSLKLIGNHCDIYVDEAMWEVKVTMENLQFLLETFETRTPTDSTQGIKGLVDSYYGGLLDTDGNGKVIFFLADVLDEYDEGRNDTDDKLFENGYVAISDTTDDPNSNQADVIYLDVDPQIVGVAPYSDWDESMLNALTYQYALLSAMHKRPNMERWMNYGIALKLQETAVGNIKFFGSGSATTVATAANELTYIADNLLKSRYDLFNVYNFFSYLVEKYPAVTDSNAVVKYLAQSEIVGMGALDSALAVYGNGVTAAESFINYATACFLDMNQESATETGRYQGIYNFEALDLVAPPSGKNAADLPWDKSKGKGAAFAKNRIAPWSFNFYVARAFTIDQVSGAIFPNSPDLSAADTLVFDGYDGIQYKAKKIMLRSGFLSPMTHDFEVADIIMNITNSKGSIPMLTDPHFEFKDMQPDTVTGVALMALIVAKTDYTQPPVTYDYVITNIVDKPEITEFYALQNPAASNYLDLFVVTERPVFNLTGLEQADVSIIGQFETTVVTLSKLHEYPDAVTIYSGQYIIPDGKSYTIEFKGRDQNGIALKEFSQSISVGMAKPTFQTEINLPDNLGRINIPAAAVRESRVVVSGAIKSAAWQTQLDIPGLDGHLEAISDVIYTSNEPIRLKKSARMTFHLSDAQLDKQNPGVYILLDNEWKYIGGAIDLDSQSLNVQTDHLGRFVIANGDHGEIFEADLLPQVYRLEQNYPNPFNPSTTIHFELPDDADISLKVFNMLGREVVILGQGHYSAGSYDISWDSAQDHNIHVASGIYFYVLETENYRGVKKMILMK